jgi:hypothetical protein
VTPRLASDDGPIFSTAAKLVEALKRSIPEEHRMRSLNRKRCASRVNCSAGPSTKRFKIRNMSTDGETVSVPATQESQARTRAFARVIGPWLVIVPGIIVLRASKIGALASEFFKSGLWVWFAGALLLFGGLLIIAFHQYWSNVPAILISLFGWILALRGLVLMAAPEMYERATMSMDSIPLADHLRRPRRDFDLALQVPRKRRGYWCQSRCPPNVRHPGLQFGVRSATSP